MYGGNGDKPFFSINSCKLDVLDSNLNTLPPDIVLSITSHSIPSPKINLFPILTFLAGFTIASHKSEDNSLKRNTSTFEEDLSFVAYNLAGYTLVLFNTSTSPFLK